FDEIFFSLCQKFMSIESSKTRIFSNVSFDSALLADNNPVYQFVNQLVCSLRGWMIEGGPEHIHLSTDSIASFGVIHFMTRYASMCENPSLRIESSRDTRQFPSLSISISFSRSLSKLVRC
ncbi:hypothetical protein PENTCL1PPCAC_21313, partial [Pristionchus entomophagus]